MSEQDYNNPSTGSSQPVNGPGAGYPPPPPYNSAPQGYGQAPPPPYGYPDPNAAQPAGGGLSDTAAGALAYVTIIPAIIFLVVAPYNQKPFIKFHAFQCLGLAVLGFCLGIVNVIPILGQIVFLFGMIGMLVLWIMCIVKASQGKAFKLPVIGNFAAQQSGYQI